MDTMLLKEFPCSTKIRKAISMVESGILEFEDGIVNHMLVERRYPLSKDLLQKMLDLGLEVERESFVALDLIRHKNWLVHKQTACGKDFSNPFMVDNLPKIVRFSTHLTSVVKGWLVHDQTVHALASPKANVNYPRANKQQHKLDEVSYHKLFDILKQYQKEVNELRAERMAKNANPLALVATAQTLQDPYYQTSKPHKSYAPTSKASLPTRSHATTRSKGKEIAKPIVRIYVFLS
ncbi:hypothetical protein Tco_0555352 [Tanacetum coccineum]